MKAKTQKVKAVPSPVFLAGQPIGASHPCVVAADAAGKLWHVNVETGEAKAVTVKRK